MRRREFIAVLGGAVAWPFAAFAQPAKLPTIGFLGAGTPSGWSHWVSAFVQRLRELGWIEGRTVNIEYRWAEGRSERYSEIATEFVRLKVDVIVSVGGAIGAVKEVTSVIPIVFAVANDPIGSGFVASLAHPGGNLTGLSNQGSDLASKHVDLLRDALPDIRQVAIMANVDYPAGVLQKHEFEAAARKRSIEIVALDVRRAADLVPAFESLQGRVNALYLCSDPLANANRFDISALAVAARLPIISGVKEYTEAGGLISYGPNFQDLWRRAADYIDRILRGTKPGDIPVEQPTKFELVVNLKTAKAIGIELPAALLSRADEVIE